MSKENIIDLFYNEHLKVNEIAKKENVSSAYITKVIKQDIRYNHEKVNRKGISKEKRKNAQNQFIKNYQRVVIYQMKVIENSILVLTIITLQRKGTSLTKVLVAHMLYQNILRKGKRYEYGKKVIRNIQIS